MLGQEGLSWPLTDQDARLGARVAGIQLSSLAFAFEGLQSDGCVPHRQQLQARNDGNVARSRSSALYIGGPTWKKVWKVTSCPRPSPTWAFPHPYWYGHHPLFCCGGGSHRYPTVGSLHSQPPPPKYTNGFCGKTASFSVLRSSHSLLYSSRRSWRGSCSDLGACEYYQRLHEERMVG